MAEVEFQNLTKVYPGGTVGLDDLSLEIADGEFMILVGPSGCGKTTALRCVAGLERPTRGCIIIGGRVVNGVAPHDRDIAMVFQNYALYPHMTVYRNLAFGLKERRTPKAVIDERVRTITAMLGLDDLLKRRPAQLSGGQRQRVAMGRALVREPKAFLLDEPLSNLDAKLRVQMRAELKRLHMRLGITTIYVTHDQVEAMTLGDRIAVMSGGRALQVGGPQEVYDHPANVFVAGFVGSPPMNLLRASARGGHVVAGSLKLELPSAPDGDVVLGLRPEVLRVSTDGAASLDFVVDVVEPLGDEIVVHGNVEGQLVGGRDEEIPTVDGEASRATITARFDPTRHPAIGDRIPLTVSPDAVHLFDTATGLAIA
jgi:sn-glycerol 3-phosphate transport system ATP-binding protein